MTSFLGCLFFILGGGSLRIETPRLIIRNFCLNDLDRFDKMKSNPKLAYMAGIKPHNSKKVSQMRLENILYYDDYFAIVKDDILIGDLNFYKDPVRVASDAFQLGFMLDEEFHHKGYMKEALTYFIPYIFKKHQIDILTCVTIINNYAAQKTIEALGFKYDGIIRHYKRLYNDDMVDCKIYTMTKDEYERNDKIWHMN